MGPAPGLCWSTDVPDPGGTLLCARMPVGTDRSPRHPAHPRETGWVLGTGTPAAGSVIRLPDRTTVPGLRHGLVNRGAMIPNIPPILLHSRQVMRCDADPGPPGSLTPEAHEPPATHPVGLRRLTRRQAEGQRDGLTGYPCGFPVRRDGSWWNGVHGLAGRLQEQLFADHHASLGATWWTAPTVRPAPGSDRGDGATSAWPTGRRAPGGYAHWSCPRAADGGAAERPRDAW